MPPSPTAESPSVTSVDQLVAWFAKGFERPEHRRVGTEHEKLILRREDLSPTPYEGPRGIGALLSTLAERFGYKPIIEKGTSIGNYRMTPNGVESITLEPGGQFELSGAPVRLMDETRDELVAHLSEVGEVLQELELIMVGTGLNGLHRLDEIPWMPKGRYQIMRNYMPRVGSMGQMMMKMTCTIQANVDFTSEEDAADIIRTSMWLTPLVSALFACSPLREGAPSGFASTRCHVWTDTDKERTGFPAFMLSPEPFGFREYVEYTLDIPMYLIAREGRYLDLTQRRFTFRDFIKDGFEGHRPTLDDYENHIGTLFPEVRLKRKYIEMRGADMGPPEMIIALPALWKGVLYDASARQEARALLDDLDHEQRIRLFSNVIRWSLDAPIPGRVNGASAQVRDLAAELVRIAGDGLDRLSLPFDSAPEAPALARPNERRYLDPLLEDLSSPEGSRAQRLLARWRELDGDAVKWMREQAIDPSSPWLTR